MWAAKEAGYAAIIAICFCLQCRRYPAETDICFTREMGLGVAYVRMSTVRNALNP